MIEREDNKIFVEQTVNISETESDIKNVSEETEVKTPQKRFKVAITILAILLVAAGFLVFRSSLVYSFAVWRFESKDNAWARMLFEDLGDYKDSKTYLAKANYGVASDFIKAKDYIDAADLLVQLGDYHNSKTMLKDCYLHIADDILSQGDYANAVNYYEKAENKEGRVKAYLKWGEKLYAENNYAGAIECWKKNTGNAESIERICRAEYELAAVAAAAGKDYDAVVKLNEHNYDDRAHNAVKALLSMDPKNNRTLSVSDNHIVYLSVDGTVHADGDNSHGQCDISGWIGIVSLCASELNTYGLVYDGTVLSAGSNAYGQCDVSKWSDIASLCATDNAVFGLKSNGTVTFSGGEAGQYDTVSGWTNISQISAGKDHIAAIDLSGKVYIAGKNECGQCDAAGSTGIVSAFCGPYRTILISSDGKVTVCGVSNELICSVSAWRDIVGISSSYSHIVGEDRSGRLFAAGENGRGQCDVSNWSDIAFFCARDNFTIMVRNDGSVITSVKGESLDWKVLLWK